MIKLYTGVGGWNFNYNYCHLISLSHGSFLFHFHFCKAMKSGVRSVNPGLGWNVSYNYCHLISLSLSDDLSFFTFTFARLWSQVFDVWTLAQAEMPVIITFTWFHVHFFMVNSFFTFTFARLWSQVWTLAKAEMPVIITFTPPSSFILSQPVGTNSKQIQPPVNHSFPQAQNKFQRFHTFELLRSAEAISNLWLSFWNPIFSCRANLRK